MLFKGLFLADAVVDGAEATNEVFSFTELIQEVAAWLSTEGLKLVFGLIVLFIVCKIINGIAKRFKKRMEKKGRDKTITVLGYKAIRYGLKALAVLCFLGFVGIDTAGIGSVIGSLGVGVGLAVNGTLSNLAGGIVILIMRPFGIGDYIEAQGEGGTVEEIGIFYTELVTPDNKVVYIPNGSLSNGSMVNYSKKDLRRVDFTFSISYEEDFERAKQVIYSVIENTQNALLDPQPFVRVVSHGESTIDISAKVWTKNEHYWDVYFDMMEAIKKNFDSANIEIPYKQLDVHIKNK
ncbi:MAG: mechanosensitive ion channel [Bacilli bacterium]|nr:mechanosensitive ion channel [Bacilli bacterium]